MAKHIHHDTVSCHLLKLRTGYVRRHQLVDVCIVHVHQSERLALGQSAQSPVWGGAVT